MTAGRPPKYEPEWMLQRIIEVMREGGSKTEVACELSISRETLYEWASDPEKQEFSDTIKRGEMLSQVWHEKAGRRGIYDKNFNSAVWIFTVKNRFRDDYKDKTESEISGPNGGSIKLENKSDSELNARILELASKVGAGGVTGNSGGKTP